MKKIIPRFIGMYINWMAIVAPKYAGRIGFNLFCTPQTPPVKPHQKKYLDTAQVSTLSVNGGSVRVYRWGTGLRKILFLHGWQSHSFRWKNYIDAFSKDEFSVYAFDAPAHGLSDGRYLNIPIYSAVIEEFFRQHADFEIIVSHSLGSFSALYTLFRIPSLPVKNLIITGTPGEVREFFDFYKDVLGLSQRAEHVIRNEFVERLNHGPEFFSAEKFAASVSIPGLIIHDETDPEAPYHHAQHVHKAWKESRLITTNGLGHNLRSPEVVRQVSDFVKMREIIHENATI